MTDSVLDAPLPARWGVVQRSKNTLIYVCLRLSVALFRRIPLGLTLLAARPLGWLAWVLDVPDRRKAMAHLDRAYPEKTARTRRAFARGMFVHLATSAIEAMHLRRLAAQTHLTPEQRTLLTDVLSEGKGVVAVTGHIGNWELLAQVVAREFPLTTIAKPLYDPRLTRWVHRERTRDRLNIIWRGQGGSSKDMLRVFRNGGILALLIDQDTNVPSVFVPFFGRLAHTPSAAAVLALRAQTPVLVAWGQRRGRKHELHIERITPPSKGDRDNDIIELTARLSNRLELAIREAPEQWVWMHERWKTQPTR